MAFPPGGKSHNSDPSLLYRADEAHLSATLLPLQSSIYAPLLSLRSSRAVTLLVSRASPLLRFVGGSARRLWFADEAHAAGSVVGSVVADEVDAAHADP